MSSYEIVVQGSRMIANLGKWMETAAEYAREKGFEPDVLAQARLAPDQYSLVGQVQAACDQAKNTAAYLSGQKPPPHPDTETTFAELQARIRTCLAYLEGFSAKDFGPAEDMRVAPPWMGGKSVRGDAYLERLAVPNLYFHVTTAYAILRHNGVALGKGDYIGIQDFSELGAE